MPRPIASNARTFSKPRWSPDGTKIAYISNTHAVWIVNADGTEMHQITHPQSGEFDLGVSWSPDGTHLVFSRSHHEVSCDGNCELYRDQLRVTTVGGGDGTVIDARQTTTPDAEYLFEQIDWSPDGSRIAVDLYHGGPNTENHDVLLVTPSGGESTFLSYTARTSSTSSPAGDGSPGRPTASAWRSRGRTVARSTSTGSTLRRSTRTARSPSATSDRSAA